MDKTKPLDLQTIVRYMRKLEPSTTFCLSSRDSISNPQREFLFILFRQFIERYFGIVGDALQMLPLAAVASVDIDQMRNSIPLMLLYKVMCSVFHDFFDIEFSMTDIVMPNAQSTHVILSAVCRFMDCHEHMTSSVEEVDRIIATMNDEISSTKHKAFLLDKQLTRERQDSESLKQRLSKLSEKHHRILNDLRTTITTGDNLKAEFEALAAELTRLTSENVAAKTKCKNLQDRENYLREAIIDDPEVVRDAFVYQYFQVSREKSNAELLSQEMREAVQKARADLAALNLQEEVQQKIVAVREAQHEDLMNVEQHLATYKRANIELTTKKLEFENTKANSESLRKDIEAQHRNATVVQEQHENLRTKHHNIIEDHKTRIEQLKTDIDKLKMSGAKESYDHAILVKQRELENIRQQMDRKEREFLSFWKNRISTMQKLCDAYARIVEKDQKLNNEISYALSSIHKISTETNLRCQNGTVVELISRTQSISTLHAHED